MIDKLANFSKPGIIKAHEIIYSTALKIAFCLPVIHFLYLGLYHESNSFFLNLSAFSFYVAVISELKSKMSISPFKENRKKIL